MSITRLTSSPYHLESQDALERNHQTMKTMLKTYCYDTQQEWDEEVPLILFSAREVVQGSLGLSLLELVFGHTV